MTEKLFHDPEHWFERAEGARRLAVQILDPVSRRTMLEITENYESLARRARLTTGGDRQGTILSKERREAFRYSAATKPITLGNGRTASTRPDAARCAKALPPEPRGPTVARREVGSAVTCR
jgi:hypothetical protein